MTLCNFPVGDFYPGRVQSSSEDVGEKGEGLRQESFICNRECGWLECLLERGFPSSVSVGDCNWHRKDFAVKRMVSTSEWLVQCTDYFNIIL